MSEFKQRELGDNGMIRVNVKDHKTVDAYGSVPLMLYPSEFEWISMFINNVKSKVSTINTNYVFISWNGNKWHQVTLVSNCIAYGKSWNI